MDMIFVFLYGDAGEKKKLSLEDSGFAGWVFVYLFAVLFFGIISMFFRRVVIILFWGYFCSRMAGLNIFSSVAFILLWL
jgi:hypothetical protein